MANADSEVENTEEDRICLSLEDEIEIVESALLPDLEKNKKDIDLRNEQFNVLLIEAIDETLASLGELVKNTLYSNLESISDSQKKIFH